MAGVQPAAEVTLYNGDRNTNAVAVFDSGSLLTAFSAEYAELLAQSPKCFVRIFQHPKSDCVLPSRNLMAATTCMLPLGSMIAAGTSNLWLDFQPG
jgi:hypothetical protein